VAHPHPCADGLAARQSQAAGRRAGRRPPVARGAGNTGAVSVTSLLERRLPPEDMVVVLREAVRLVANILQQAQGVRVPAQPPRLVLAWNIDFLLLLGQRNRERR